MMNFGVVLFLLFMITSCSNSNNNVCRYKQCDKQATGWKHYSTTQRASDADNPKKFITDNNGEQFCHGCCKIESSGGYCSVSHCVWDGGSMY